MAAFADETTVQPRPQRAGRLPPIERHAQCQSGDSKSPSTAPAASGANVAGKNRPSTAATPTSTTPCRARTRHSGTPNRQIRKIASDQAVVAGGWAMVIASGGAATKGM